MNPKEITEISEVLDKLRLAFVQDKPVILSVQEVKVLGHVMIGMEHALTDLQNSSR